MEQARRKIATEADGWAKENARCAADIFHWIDNWVWQYDPRLVGQYDDAGQPIPTYFKPTLWEEQREFVDWFRERIARQEEGLSDKSRDTGVTYLCLMCCLHAWRYTDGFKATFGSRTEDCVDKVGNPDSIFEKLRVIVDRMPDEMLPPSFERRRHSSYMKLINPNNGSSIVGEGGPNMGRSGRSSVFVADEAAHMPEADKVARALSGNIDGQSVAYGLRSSPYWGDCIFAERSPLGRSTTRAQRRQQSPFYRPNQRYSSTIVASARYQPRLGKRPKRETRRLGLRDGRR